MVENVLELKLIGEEQRCESKKHRYEANASDVERTSSNDRELLREEYRQNNGEDTARKRQANAKLSVLSKK